MLVKNSLRLSLSAYNKDSSGSIHLILSFFSMGSLLVQWVLGFLRQNNVRKGGRGGGQEQGYSDKTQKSYFWRKILWGKQLQFIGQYTRARKKGDLYVLLGDYVFSKGVWGKKVSIFKHITFEYMYSFNCYTFLELNQAGHN